MRHALAHNPFDVGLFGADLLGEPRPFPRLNGIDRALRGISAFRYY